MSEGAARWEKLATILAACVFSITLFLVFLLVTSVPGCATKTTNGDESTYTESAWGLTGRLALGCGACLLAGLLLFGWVGLVEREPAPPAGFLRSLANCTVQPAIFTGVLVLIIGLVVLPCTCCVCIPLGLRPEKDHVKVGAHHVEVWVARFSAPEKKHDISFADIREITWGKEWVTIARGGLAVPFKRSYVEFILKTGERRVITEVDEPLEAALPEIIDKAEVQGVRVTHQDR